MGNPVSLKGHQHACPMCDPRAHIGGPVQRVDQSFVTVNGIPIATVGDHCLCTGVGATAVIAEGSSVAVINGKKIARLGDSTDHGGRLVQGESWITFD